MLLEFIFDLTVKIATILRDIAPVVVVIIAFQLLVLRKPIPLLKNVLIGFVAVIIGLFLFLEGLEIGIFPIGEAMAGYLVRPDMRFELLLFAFCIGYATTVAEPTLLAITKKTEEITAGGLNSLALRNIVAIGVGAGITLGVWRIFDGTPLWIFILTGYIFVVILTAIAPKDIVPLAYDLGGVTTSTVTVPLITALGLGLTKNMEDSNPLVEGFGLIAFASLFPMLSILIYAIVSRYVNSKRIRR